MCADVGLTAMIPAAWVDADCTSSAGDRGLARDSRAVVDGKRKKKKKKGKREQLRSAWAAM
jgi:hypothetical protein